MGKNHEMIRDALLCHGIDPSFSRHIRISETEGDDGPRGMVAIGYTSSGQWRETAIASTCTPEEAGELVRDSDRLAALIALGVRAMPPSERPDIPDWVAKHPDAQRTVRELARARSLANNAAADLSNRPREPEPDDVNSPF